MSELVERSGVPAATIRYYLASGLLPPPRRAKANRFWYDERHVEVIRLIRLLQERRSLSLETIGRMLPELLPDLIGGEEGHVFRPEMWGQLLAAHFPSTTRPSLADRLVAAALEAFSSRGYADVSVDDVCRAAGVSKGSFYRHFSSKEELFYAVVERVGDAIAAALDASASSPDAALEARAWPGTDGAVSRRTFADALAGVLSPYMVILADLISLAARRRPGHTEALAKLWDRLVAAATDRFAARLGLDARGADALLDEAFSRAVRHVVGLADPLSSDPVRVVAKET